MNHHISRAGLLRTAAGLLGATASLSALAQEAEGITITFTTASVSSVPVGGWASALLVLAIGLAAFLWNRKHLSGTLRAFALTAVAGLAAVAALQTQEARAVILPEPFNLVTSPTFEAAVEGVRYYQATNETGGAIVLQTVAVNIFPYTINEAETTCTHGKPMAPNASCLISLSLSAPAPL